MKFKRRAAKYGKKVAVVEVTAHLGGTCVNVGTLSPILFAAPAKKYVLMISSSYMQVVYPRR